MLCRGKFILLIISRKLLTQKRPAMERDHQIFIGRNDPGGCLTAFFCNLRPAPVIRGLIDLKAEPRRLLAHPPPDIRGVFADTRRKDRRIEAAQSGGERTQFPADAVHEKIDRLVCVRIAACEQGPHVVADARDAEQS